MCIRDHVMFFLLLLTISVDCVHPKIISYKKVLCIYNLVNSQITV